MAGNANWIEKATANSHGQFAAKAKAAGMTTKQFAKKKHKGVTAKQAALAKTLLSFNKGKK